MKNIFTLLSEAGIELPEDKKTGFETAFNENYKTVAEVEKVKTARDNYKSQLETAQETLRSFSGVDVNELQGRITQLTNDLAAKETEYQGKLADMEFANALEKALTDVGAKNTKAVKALLDIESLKSSKNQAEDIQKAVETVKKENDYLFQSEQLRGWGQRQTGHSGNVDAVEAAFLKRNPDITINK